MNTPIAYSYVLRLRCRDSLAKADSYRMVFTRSRRPIPEMAEKGSNLSFRIIRDQKTTDLFIEGLRLATAAQRFQVTTDGFIPYVSAICNTLEDRVDFAQLIKVYAQSPEGERRYSPAEVVEAQPKPILGDPDKKKICTSHVERQNLSIRMGMRRLTRLTNAFSKKWDNLWAAYCLWFAFYNFVRVHQTLRVTPAMEAGITDRVWNLEDLISN